MRVGGKARTWKGKGKLVEEDAEDGEADGLEGRTGFGNHRHSVSPSSSPPNRNFARPLPPPVVIHSPVKTPRDRVSTSPPPLRAPDSGAIAAYERRPRFADAAQLVGTSYPGGPGSASSSSPGDYLSRPLAAVSVPSSEASYISPSLASSPSQTPASSHILRPPLPPTVEVSPEQPAGPAQAAAQSQASSGISLFGTSVAQGSAQPPQELEQPPPPPAVVDPQPLSAPAGPVFQLPPGLKVRERRRVNIRGLGPLIPLNATLEKPKEGETGAAALPPAPVAKQTQRVAPPAPPTENILAVPPPSRSPSSSSESVAKSSSLFPPRSTYLSTPSPRPLPAGQKSALSLLLSSASTASSKLYNPFSRLYQSCISRAPGPDPSTLNLALYFPFSSRPAQPLKIRVKRDVTVEEVIGAGLWAYWEDEGREPKLDGESIGVKPGEAEEGRETTRWNLRIVEEDGEVDEDFPALDRLRNVSAFSFTEFAIVRATSQQIEDNAAKQASIVRRPSRILSTGPTAAGSRAPSRRHSNVPTPHGPGTATPVPPAGGERGIIESSTCAAGSALAVPVELKVEVRLQYAERSEIDVQVPFDMYIADLLEHICKRISPIPPPHPRDCALVVRLSDGDIVTPLDRTVASLGEHHTLVLVPRSQVGAVGLRRRDARSADPSESIFTSTQPVQPAQRGLPSALEVVAPYQHFNVLRKLPMSLGGRHARVIAIDGDYLHFMPPDDGRGAGGGTHLLGGASGRTTSFHISQVHTCKISRRSASSLKIVVHTNRSIDKRYDFEAESPALAQEIVRQIRAVMQAYQAGHPV
ncbi:stress activated MAP kinase interacting protein Sin1 [Rhodotorula toruloides]|uniref:Stress activated MAP kinase interacting protein Sin1 n=1 Tax=Rhodotorula toruloides TaxID=5286 RepID=A0A511KML2_RHOTO|nr:stress activated MAP kinase interacting protein Sin1 [Rhodotorula toruloides]